MVNAKKSIKQSKKRGNCGSEKYAKIEILEKQHGNFNTHKKIKEIADIYKKNCNGNIMNKNNIMTGNAEKFRQQQK